MKKEFKYGAGLFVCFIWAFVLIQKTASQTMCIEAGSDQITGIQDGYRYELWNQNSLGTACITLGSGALFSGEWAGITNYLARRGLGYDQTLEHQEIGRFFSNYACTYSPAPGGGNSYLSVYGWTVEPLIEYYIIEDWRNWIPSMDASAVLKGSINVNGSIYDIYENTRTNQPSILGNTTFQQYFSIRRNVRNSGTINITDHFEEWESLGMELGKLHEVSFVVEGYQNNGSFAFTDLSVTVNTNPVNNEATNEQETSFDIFPNPGSGEVTININNLVAEVNMRIYNALGKVIYSKEYINDKSFTISDLKRGVYYVDINNNSTKYNTQLLVF